ncbi:hypothetical protein [Rhizobium leguminosarum]|uniref:hypothetical protein n=1 Tax=Rhizobium leguminosarum TaxID=384 RepID=UPI0010308818|nr:hypothetical protein [Rhizobium leguminosarum]TBF65685.1 hypothetical protein ELG89_34590 [Rhizobium leguminosarum]
MWLSKLTLCGAVLMAASARAQDNMDKLGLDERVWQPIASSLEPLNNPKNKPTYWTLERPVSFSLIQDSDLSDVEAIIHDILVGPVVDVSCINTLLSRLEKEPEEPAAPTQTAIQDAKDTFLKEKNFSARDLKAWEEYWTRHRQEMQRLSLLPADQALVEAYKLKNIETDWDIFGRREDFRDLESKLDAIAAPLDAKPNDMAATIALLKAEIFANNSKRLQYTLSVPATQWSTFDSWQLVRKKGGKPGVALQTSSAPIPSNAAFNSGSCGKKGCSTKLSSELLPATTISMSILAPQIEFPWKTKFRKAVSKLSPAPEPCDHGSRLDRLILIRMIGSNYDGDKLPEILHLLASKQPFDAGGFLFAGTPDVGVPYYSSPIFTDGILVSPFYYIAGFTTVSDEQGAK